jgi:hypothetical protein
MPGMNKKRVIFASIIMLGFASSAAFSEEDVGHHKYPHHHLALFAGGGFERDKNGHEEHGAALGLEYEIRYSEKWGAGVDFEILSGGDTHRSSVLAVPVSYHPNEKWRLFAGPGIEFGEKHDKYLARFGVGYEIHVKGRWVLSPEIIADFVEGGATTYVLGVAIGYGF